MVDNIAAWLPSEKADFVVKEAPYVKPEPKEVVVKAGAVAANPLDHKIQRDAPKGFPLKYPTIIGCDLAGTVVEIGSEVTNFRVGDRVMAHTYGFYTGQPKMSAFQKYVVTNETGLISIPAAVTFEQAAVLPLSCDTAMAGLYMEDFLGLQLPSANAVPTNQTLLVWGGSSSVGCSVIQMARASGYEVAAVASKRNHALCSELGATAVFDYAGENVVETIVAGLKGKQLVGAYDCIGDQKTTIPICTNIISRCEGRKKVLAVLEPPTEGLAPGVEAQRVFIPKMLGTDLPVKMRKWMEVALLEKKLLPKPDPHVVGHGLEAIQVAVDTLRKGVSASKLVATID